MADNLADMAAIMNDPGIYKGVAMSRRTRTPIIFRKLDPNTGGEHPPDILPLDMHRLAMAHINPMASTGQINIDPVNASNIKDEGGIPAVIRHESAHAALDEVPDKELLQMQKSIPQYQDIARQVRQTRDVSAGVGGEVPAYMASNAATTGVDPTLQQGYLSAFQQQLQKKFPRAAGMYSSIVNGQRAAQAPASLAQLGSMAGGGQ